MKIGTAQNTIGHAIVAVKAIIKVSADIATVAKIEITIHVFFC